MILLDYIEKLQSNGKLWFTKNEAQQELGCSELAITKAISRLIQKKRLVTLKPGFIFIVPTEYKSWGIVPADWFIDPLMRYLAIPYYVGLLTAASYYGAAHQKPQIFQVMASQKVEEITKERVQVKFYSNQDLALIPINKISVHTGYMPISSPEATALDLVKYYRACGHLSNVATVLSELREKIHEDQLLELIRKDIYEMAVIQRFGYLMSLEDVGGKQLVKNLEVLIAQEKPRFIPLQPGMKYSSNDCNITWRLYTNELIEVD